MLLSCVECNVCGNFRDILNKACLYYLEALCMVSYRYLMLIHSLSISFAYAGSHGLVDSALKEMSFPSAALQFRQTNEAKQACIII